MNYVAKEFNLQNTYFKNPHGLVNKDNVSTAEDIGKLAFILN